MFKRAFFLTVGLGAGVALGIYTVRKLEATQRRLAPDHLANTASTRIGEARGRWAAAVAVGRDVASAKEAELRAVYRSRPLPDPAPNVGST